MSKRILCVEDNPQNMRLIRKLLTHEGYNVLEAENGLNGVQMALEQHPDLVLMDLNLPDIDGLEATQRIKSVAKEIPIVALTANAMFGDEERCMAAGCDGYISKPVSRSLLVEKLVQMLGEKS
jgi:two-component system cell cycle response regulator DivK